jgi:DNA modification methylase
MSITIHVGSCLDALAAMPARSVHCAITSPPYFRARDYGVAKAIGNEPTVAAHISELVRVFDAVARVLRPDGSLWLNYGDIYATPALAEPALGIKPKDLMGLPWRVAIALQSAGWHLRSEIIWSKRNPMPSSAADRPASSHEHVFLLTREPTYYFDGYAVREPRTTSGPRAGHFASGRLWDAAPKEHRAGELVGAESPNMETTTRNLRDVWTVTTDGFPDAHFATFPPAIVVPCIKAGTSEKGACVECGSPWRREVEASGGSVGRGWHDHRDDKMRGQRKPPTPGYTRHDRGFSPSCDCGGGRGVVPAVVLDPFGGAGTVAMVADRLGRDAILCEINPEYAEMARRRIVADAPLFADVTVSK